MCGPDRRLVIQGRVSYMETICHATANSKDDLATCKYRACVGFGSVVLCGDFAAHGCYQETM